MGESARAVRKYLFFDARAVARATNGALSTPHIVDNRVGTPPPQPLRVHTRSWRSLSACRVIPRSVFASTRSFFFSHTPVRLSHGRFSKIRSFLLIHFYCNFFLISFRFLLVRAAGRCFVVVVAAAAAAAASHERNQTVDRQRRDRVQRHAQPVRASSGAYFHLR